MSETTGEVGTTTPETAVEPRLAPALVSVARLDVSSLPSDPAAGVLVLAADAAVSPAALGGVVPAPDEFQMAPGPAAAAWQSACDVGPAAGEQTVAGPLGCLLAADGLVAPAGALAEVLARGSWRQMPGSGGLVSLAHALTETGLVPREASAPAPDAAVPAPDQAPQPAAAELAAVAHEVPVLRALRRVTGRHWARPVLHVTVGPEPIGREALVSLVDRWLSSSVEDLVVSIPHPLPEYGDDPRVLVAGTGPLPIAPYLLRWPASLAPGLRTAAGLLDVALQHGCGLVRVRTVGREETPSLTRTAVVARLAGAGITEPDAADYEHAAGTWWADGGHFGVTTTPACHPAQWRGSGWTPAGGGRSVRWRRRWPGSRRPAVLLRRGSPSGACVAGGHGARHSARLARRACPGTPVGTS